MANLTKTKQLALIGLAAAFISITGPLTLPLPFSPVPVSLCTLAISLCSYLLGSKCAIMSVLVYLCMGFLGIPVFAGFTAGPGRLLGPTGGYLIGYPVLALVCGQSHNKGRLRLVLLNLLGTCICYFIGTLWLAFQSNLSLSAACITGIVPFLPGDLIKLLLLALSAPDIRRRLHL